MPKRTVSDNAGAELRAWLLAKEQAECAAVMGPPQTPADGRPPAQVDAAVWDIFTDNMAAFWRPLAEDKAYRLRRSDLPMNHPARRLGHLSDYLVLTEANELVDDDDGVN